MGHRVVNTSHQTVDETARALALHLHELLAHWTESGLADSGLTSPYTTTASVGQLLGWVNDVKEVSV
jgi:hypothetical protein